MSDDVRMREIATRKLDESEAVRKEQALLVGKLRATVSVLTRLLSAEQLDEFYEGRERLVRAELARTNQISLGEGL